MISHDKWTAAYPEMQPDIPCIEVKGRGYLGASLGNCEVTVIHGKAHVTYKLNDIINSFVALAPGDQIRAKILSPSASHEITLLPTSRIIEFHMNPTQIYIHQMPSLTRTTLKVESIIDRIANPFQKIQPFSSREVLMNAIKESQLSTLSSNDRFDRVEHARAIYNTLKKQNPRIPQYQDLAIYCRSTAPRVDVSILTPSASKLLCSFHPPDLTDRIEAELIEGEELTLSITYPGKKPKLLASYSALFPNHIELEYLLEGKISDITAKLQRTISFPTIEAPFGIQREHNLEIYLIKNEFEKPVMIGTINCSPSNLHIKLVEDFPTLLEKHQVKIYENHNSHCGKLRPLKSLTIDKNGGFMCSYLIFSEDESGKLSIW